MLALALGLLPSCTEPAYPDGGVADADADTAASMSRDGGAQPKPDAASTPPDPPKDDAGEQLVPVADARVPTETADDGGQVPLASSIPSWASPLLGRYAARMYAFSQDKAGSKQRARELVLVDFVELQKGTPDAYVQLQLQLCDSFVDGTAGDLNVVSPLKATRRDNRVLFGGDKSWTTQAAAARDGFTRELPARCEAKAGMMVSKDPAQTWIVGTQCRCPSSPDAVPTVEDCRVVDSDGDGHPGATMHFHPEILLDDADLYVATVNQTTLVNGTVGSAGRHTAQLSSQNFGYQLGCDKPSCWDISETPAPCGPARNKAEFVRLGEAGDTSFSCQTVLDRAGELFPTALPEYPEKCPD